MAKGLAHRGKSDLEQAICDYNKAIELDPSFAKAYNNLAWILATHQDAQLRDGAQAVRLAERTCELTDYKVPANLDTLAAAHAEADQFDKAVKTAEKAVQLALATGKEKLAKAIQSRLESYKVKHPHRESFKPEGLGTRQPE